MKKILLTLVIAIASYSIYAQTNTFPSSGNVGIGTTSPGDLLQVSNGSTMRFQVSAAKGIWVTNEINGGTASSPGVLYLNYSSLGNTLLNSNGGNVGIGTTSPIAKLEVFDGNGTGAISYFGANGITNAKGLYFSRPTINTNPVNIQGSQVGVGATDISFQAEGGNVGIGTSNPQGYKLAINGGAIATSMTVKIYGNWPDFVFHKDYKLPTLDKVKNYIDRNQHLPEIPSADDVHANGLNLGEINRLLTKKVEELTLYLIEEHDKNAKLEDRMKALEVKFEKATH